MTASSEDWLLKVIFSMVHRIPLRQLKSNALWHIKINMIVKLRSISVYFLILYQLNLNSIEITWFSLCILLSSCPPEIVAYYKVNHLNAHYSWKLMLKRLKTAALQGSHFFHFFLKTISKKCPLMPDKSMQKFSRGLTPCRQCRRVVSKVRYLEASLFFSLRDRARATAGRSLTGPMPSMAALSFCSCSPMLWSFWGFGVRSLASVLRALRRPFLPKQKMKEWSQYLSAQVFQPFLVQPFQLL